MLQRLTQKYIQTHRKTDTMIKKNTTKTNINIKKKSDPSELFPIIYVKNNFIINDIL